ncbi:MAG TPA: 16S rRNA (cytosine(967)-C(5))-methyltransferase RsmB [Thermodesulfobacteriota bacterium]|nr:16S rRNA (cytosine(967)-C(5))-methyltransferase RsmB [Thermodesulfobacteriota bacterium]
MANARDIALNVLLTWQRTGTYPDQLLREGLGKDRLMSSADRALSFQLVYGVLRWLGKLDWILRPFSNRPLNKLSPKTLMILRLGAFQLLFLSRIPPSAAVNESVKLAKTGRAKWTAPYVNAVLRSLERGKEALPAPSREEPVSYLSIQYAHPSWLVQQWVGDWGAERAEAFCQADNQIPPLVLRTNTLKTDRPQLLKDLQAKGLQAVPTCFSTEGIRIEDPDHPLVQDDLFRKGLFQIQDEASQLITYMLNPCPGERVLDLCAGAGGKATHLAQRMHNQGEILSVDLHRQKIASLENNARRLGIRIIRGITGDGLGNSLFPETVRSFDRVLIDAPCSGWGVIRRNPDLKWRLKPEDGTRLAAMQNKFLQNGARWLKSKGILVYATCTLNRVENQEVVENFLGHHPDFSLEDISPFMSDSAKGLVDSEGYYHTWPPEHGTDGFFAARLRKK